MCERHFYRCADCLTVSAADEYTTGALCGHCNGKIEYMGRVERSRLVETVERCPCDARCTFARGPNCECQCGGDNHGQGILVEFIRDAGPVPVLRPTASGLAAKQTAKEFREAYAKALVEFQTIESRRGGRVFSITDYNRSRTLYASLNAARKSRVHKSRMMHLRAPYREEIAPAPTTMHETQPVLF